MAGEDSLKNTTPEIDINKAIVDQAQAIATYIPAEQIEQWIINKERELLVLTNALRFREYMDAENEPNL